MVVVAGGVILAGLILFYFANMPFIREARAGFGA
jgi:hypothetical protein